MSCSQLSGAQPLNQQHFNVSSSQIRACINSLCGRELENQGLWVPQCPLQAGGNSSGSRLSTERPSGNLAQGLVKCRWCGAEPVVCCELLAHSDTLVALSRRQISSVAWPSAANKLIKSVGKDLFQLHPAETMLRPKSHRGQPLLSLWTSAPPTQLG